MLQLRDEIEPNLSDVLIPRAVGIDTIGRDTILNSATLTAKSCHCPQRKGRKQNYCSAVI